MEWKKMPNFRNGSKCGFEPGLTWLRVRRSTTELPRSMSGEHASTASQNTSFLTGKLCKLIERILRGLVVGLHACSWFNWDDLSTGWTRRANMCVIRNARVSGCVIVDQGEHSLVGRNRLCMCRCANLIELKRSIRARHTWMGTHIAFGYWALFVSTGAMASPTKGTECYNCGNKHGATHAQSIGLRWDNGFGSTGSSHLCGALYVVSINDHIACNPRCAIKCYTLTKFNKIAIQARAQMAADKEAVEDTTVFVMCWNTMFITYQSLWATTYLPMASEVFYFSHRPHNGLCHRQRRNTNSERKKRWCWFTG